MLGQIYFPFAGHLTLGGLLAVSSTTSQQPEDELEKFQALCAIGIFKLRLLSRGEKLFRKSSLYCGIFVSDVCGFSNFLIKLETNSIILMTSFRHPICTRMKQLQTSMLMLIVSPKCANVFRTRSIVFVCICNKSSPKCLL